MPGPGHYNPKIVLPSKEIILYLRERVVDFADRSKQDLPGPGSYQLFSDFGNVVAPPLLTARKHQANVKEQQATNMHMR
jgi:hypothetical protein